MIKKIIASLKRDGFAKTVKKGIRYIKRRILVRNAENNIKNFVNVADFSTIIVYENNFGWKRLMKQRPQQIAEHLPNDTLIFYHTHDDEDYPKKERIYKIKDNLVLIDLGYCRDNLLEELKSHNNKYLMIYSTDYIPYERIKMYEDYGFTLIYEYVDDINEDLSGKDMFKVLNKRHKKILNDNPCVICTANKLFEKIDKEKNQYCKLITNAVDYEHFEYKEYEVPSDLKDIREQYETLVCYYGALASWFDYELVKKIAQNKKLGIVLLGYDYDKTIEKSNILENENIFYLGRKDYEDLPRYGCNVDIFMIPFLINDITSATSPVKIFEYMAMEKPIVTTALPECKKYKSVLFSNNFDEFVANIDKAMTLKNDKEYRTLLKKEAQENTWTQKAEDMVHFINVSKYNKIHQEVEDMFANEMYDRIVIWRSPFGWNVPLFQRPQHIDRQLAKNKCLVLYEVTHNTDYVPTLVKQEDNLYLVNFENYVLKEIINDVLKKYSKPKYLQIYSTNWSMSVEEMKEYIEAGFKVIYEYIDDINPDLSGTDEIPPYILDKYNYAMEHKEILIVTTAKEIFEDVKSKRGTENMVFSCNGVDYDFYQSLDKNYEFEKEFLKVINNGKINVCYYGALAKWFDYELIRKIDSTDKYNIILFGIKYDTSYDDSKIDALKNVHFFGAKDYNVLKYYASKMDVLTIPFLINSITQATSPLKLFEYMALKKPIITTAMNECKNYKSVQIAESHEQFVELLEKCESLSKDKKYIELLEKEAKENDWAEKAKVIVDLMKENE